MKALGLILIGLTSIVAQNIFPATGAVGIGTTSPNFQLQVSGTTGIGVRATGVDGNFTDILSSIYSGNSNEQNAIQSSVSSIADNSGFNFMVSDGGGLASQKQAYRMTRATHRFYIGGSEKLRIASDGNVGIGTTNPNSKLDVNGIIQAGPVATHGGIIFAQKYSGDDYLGTISSNHSSGNLVLGYGAAGKNNLGSNKFASTFDNWSGYRSALSVGAGILDFSSTSSKVQTSVGTELSMSSRFKIATNGYIGIGTTTPSEKLDVEGNINATGQLKSTSIQVRKDQVGSTLISSQNYQNDNSARAGLRLSTYNGNWDIFANRSGTMKLWAPGATPHEVFSISSSTGKMTFAKDAIFNGNVGIGTTNPQSELAVNGTISAKKVKVTMSGWADFVFADDYDLPSLESTEKFIKENKHLPNIPSEAEVKKNGVDVGDMQVKLLQKIEELTLHMIEMKKENDKQNKLIKELYKKNAGLRAKKGN